MTHLNIKDIKTVCLHCKLVSDVALTKCPRCEFKMQDVRKVDSRYNQLKDNTIYTAEERVILKI